MVILEPHQRAAVLAKHPETQELIYRLADVLRDPDEVRRSVRRDDTVLYYRFDRAVFGGKWLVAVVKRAERFYLSTFYVTDRIKSGAILWTR